MANLHWFFNYENKDWRVVAETAEKAKAGMANLIGKSYEELSTPQFKKDENGEVKKVRGPLVRFDRVETADGTLVYKAQ
jgi:hypothetical protein